MSHIRGKNTNPELYIRRLLFSEGYRYRLYVKTIPGHPDLWLKKYNTAVFIHGCFWHRHENCEYAYSPKTRSTFWNEKFTKNVIRDKRTYDALLRSRKKCLVIWECTVKKMKKDASINREVFSKIKGFFENSMMYLEL